MTLGVAILLGLAAHRLWRGLGVDDAPWLERARARLVGAKTVVLYEIPGKPTQTVTHYSRPALKKLIECPACLGSYVAAGLVVLWLEAPSFAVWPVGLLAVADVVIIIHRNLDPSED